jgi:archaellum component FlaC
MHKLKGEKKNAKPSTQDKKNDVNNNNNKISDIYPAFLVVQLEVNPLMINKV